MKIVTYRLEARARFAGMRRFAKPHVRSLVDGRLDDPAVLLGGGCISFKSHMRAAVGVTLVPSVAVDDFDRVSHPAIGRSFGA